MTMHEICQVKMQFSKLQKRWYGTWGESETVSTWVGWCSVWSLFRFYSSLEHYILGESTWHYCDSYVCDSALCVSWLGDTDGWVLKWRFMEVWRVLGGTVSFMCILFLISENSTFFLFKSKIIKLVIQMLLCSKLGMSQPWGDEAILWRVGYPTGNLGCLLGCYH